MKLSISLPGEDIRFLDSYAQTQGIGSRSGVIRAALQLLRTSALIDDYVSAWAEQADDDGETWDRSVSDGLGP
ncbi:MAG: antitoxin [Gammaproteobacteria bacterium]|nr:antitoxin [Gammaproteobacteria bacterium]